MDDLIKSPENKIKDLSKILDTTSSNINKSLISYKENISDLRQTEKSKLASLQKLFSTETVKKTPKESSQASTTQSSMMGGGQLNQAEKPTSTATPTSGGMAESADSGLGVATVAGSATLLNGKKFAKEEDITSVVSTSGFAPGTFLAFSPYGMRSSGMHKGLDISGPTGTFIALKEECEVLGASVNGDNSGFGKWIAVWVPSLSVQLLFGHCNAVFVSRGKIPAGKSFATLGSTGRSTGPHIHLQYSRTKNVFQTDGPPDAYVNYLHLTKQKSESITPLSQTRPQQSSPSRSNNLQPSSRQNTINRNTRSSALPTPSVPAPVLASRPSTQMNSISSTRTENRPKPLLDPILMTALASR